MKKILLAFIMFGIGCFISGCDEEGGSSIPTNNPSTEITDSPTKTESISNVKTVEELFAEVKAYDNKEEVIQSVNNVMITQKINTGNVETDSTINSFKSYYDFKNIYYEQIDMIGENDGSAQKIGDTWVGGGMMENDHSNAQMMGSIYLEAMESVYLWNAGMSTSYQTYNVLTDDFIKHLKIDGKYSNGTGKIVFNSTEGINIEVNNSYVGIPMTMCVYEYVLEFENYLITKQYSRISATFENTKMETTQEALYEYNSNYEPRWLINE